MTEQTVYLAGGCFWGVELLMQSIPGVLDATSGYANGTCEADATYPSVCTGKTGFRETVRVRYDADAVSLDHLLFAYFAVIDPAAVNRQGHDVGSQYQAGIYYTDEEAKATIERVANIVRRRTDGFAVEIGPLVNFFAAEAYHQDYLDKNPNGYCHIPREHIERLSRAVVDAGRYALPAGERLASLLTPEQYAVTQQAATERPFANAYCGETRRGIYVDVVTGEPLFLSRDKYISSCGWPAFQRPLEEAVVVTRRDDSHGMRRTEVLSRAGGSHLGHVFTHDPESPNGVRYCINSAALRFIPYEEMEAEGYAYLLGAALADGF